MKKIISFFTIIYLSFMVNLNSVDKAISKIYDNIINKYNYSVIEQQNNFKEKTYHSDTISSYVSDTNDYLVNNKEELRNIYYTTINNGYDELTFYCDGEYKDCMKDIENLDKENENFSYINQLVNVYNSYSSIESTYVNNKVDIKVNKRYSKEDIERINKEIDKIIIEQNINAYSNPKDKIKVFHDYIANNNKYDEERASNGTSIYHSDNAIGTLFEGKSICSGYSDAMSIFLNRINIENVRVATDNHVWNVVKLDKWYHLDLTWDDPVMSDGSDIIQYDYFLIDDNELLSKDNEHNYDKNIYDFIK